MLFLILKLILPPQYAAKKAMLLRGYFFYVFKAITNIHFSEKITTIPDLADNILSKTRTHKPNVTDHETIDYDNRLGLKQNKHEVLL